MAQLAELAPHLPRAHLRHLSRLMRTWAPLADISFADLLLCVPRLGAAESSFVVVGHVRPTTAWSVYRTEMVGEIFTAADRPLVELARVTGTIADGGIIGPWAASRLRTLSVPVRCDGDVIAVLTREFSPDEQRAPGELEMMYFFTFRRLAQMIAEGSYPFDIDQEDVDEEPRVSDGVLLIDASARVRFGSPNAMSVLHRMGVGQVEGRRLSSAGVEQRAVRTAFATRLPQTAEIELADKTAVLRCIPIIEGPDVTGALVLIRDISELRRRDRLLLSKDATIAEIHHRVKNNLQTVSSLLRLQGRRVVAEEARLAIEESVRRIRSIAVVHEILSGEVSSDVPFEEVVKPLTRLVEEGYSSVERPLRFRVVGEAGELATEVATPLAVVLSELLQNAVEHGFSGKIPSSDAEVEIRFESGPAALDMWVTDNGRGVVAGFDVDAAAGLGLTIVRSLVENDLGGSISIGPAPEPEPGTRVHVRVPHAPAVKGWRDGLAASVGRDAPRRDPSR